LKISPDCQSLYFVDISGTILHYNTITGDLIEGLTTSSLGISILSGSASVDISLIGFTGIEPLFTTPVYGILNVSNFN